MIKSDITKAKRKTWRMGNNKNDNTTTTKKNYNKKNNWNYLNANTF